MMGKPLIKPLGLRFEPETPCGQQLACCRLSPALQKNKLVTRVRDFLSLSLACLQLWGEASWSVVTPVSTPALAAPASAH